MELMAKIFGVITALSLVVGIVAVVIEYFLRSKK